MHLDRCLSRNAYLTELLYADEGEGEMTLEWGVPSAWSAGLGSCHKGRSSKSSVPASAEQACPQAPGLGDYKVHRHPGGYSK